MMGVPDIGMWVGETWTRGDKIESKYEEMISVAQARVEIVRLGNYDVGNWRGDLVSFISMIFHSCIFVNTSSM